MKQDFRSLLCAAALLLPSVAMAQTPVPYLVTSTCPGSANNPSVLRLVPPTGTPVTVGVVNVAGTGVVVNGLGADSADPLRVYAMESVTGSGNTLQPPRFYQINLATAAATPLGTVGPPPVPAATFPNIGQSFVINQAADAGPNSNYYLTGASLVYNLLTNTVSNVRLYLGEISLAPVPTPATPTWRLVNTSSPAAVAIINTLTTQANAYLAGGPLPDGGFQDIAYVPATGNIVAYLGVEQKFVVVSNITSPTPVVSVLTPSVLLPTPGGSGPQIGSLFRDGTGRFFGLRSSTGRAYQIDPVTGNYLGNTYFTLLGCTLGDATTAPGQIVLPVTLSRFAVAATPAGTELAWQTATEENVRQFVVERSADGRAWADGAAVPATNQHGGARYTLIDQDRSDATRYYRLRVEDRDGTRAWSEVLSVRTGDAKTVTLLPVWPNPARTHAALALSAPVTGEAQLMNQLGQRVWRGAFTAGRVEIDVRALPKGIYEIVARLENGQTVRQRLLVNHE